MKYFIYKRVWMALLCLVSFTANSWAIERASSVDTEKIAQLKASQDDLSHRLDAVQRDQLNYRIEKDLLKEAYASNLQVINIVLTSGLGLVGILGFLGIRSVSEVKKEYREELEKIRTLKQGFETELKSLRDTQEELSKKLLNVKDVNEDQEKRLEQLELIEKIGGLISSGSFEWALEHIEVGLKRDPAEDLLLSQKAFCLSRTGNLASAANVYEKIYSLKPDNSGNMLNLLESMALLGRADRFEEIYKLNKQTVDLRRGLLDFAKSILSLMQDDVEGAKATLLDFAKGQPEGPTARIEGKWNFEDAQVHFSKNLHLGEKVALANCLISYFSGAMTNAQLSEALKVE